MKQKFDLNWLCDGSGTHPTRSPFQCRHGGKTYDLATDGHILIAILGDSETEVESPEIFNGAIDLFIECATALDAFNSCGQELPLPEYVRHEKCEWCNGSGKVRHVCDCRMCDYSGDDECGECGGTGSDGSKTQTVQFNGSWLNGAYFAMTAAIFGTKVDAVIMTDTGRGNLQRAGLKFANGYAIIMPMHYMDRKECTAYLRKEIIDFINNKERESE